MTIGFAVCSLTPVRAAPLDVYGVEDDIPKTAASPIVGGICVFGALSDPLTLREAVERGLCAHPKTREAWAAIKVRSEAVGVASAAFLPTLSATGQDIREVTKTVVKGNADLDSKIVSSTYTEGLSLSWVLYDFGGRSAAYDNAAELLAAAEASHQATLQQVFAAVAKDYYAAQAAQGAYAAAVETERTAKDSFDVSTRRVDKGASPISDALQAQTAYYQARVALAKADGDWRNAMGTLAADMLLRPDASISLPDVDSGVKPDVEFQQSVTALIDEAVRQHPSVRAAEAQLRAAEATVRQTEAEDEPSISLIGKSSRNNQPVSASLGFPSHHATATDNYIGVQVSVPLFDGFSVEYKTRQAKAQAEVQQYTVEEARQQVGVDVLTSYQTLQAATRNLTNSAKLRDIAQQSYTVAQRRYATGVGAMIELLNAQSALAGARKQKIQSLTDWRTSRLQLAGKLGRLGMEHVEGE
jgi:outer membrane protein